MSDDITKNNTLKNINKTVVKHQRVLSDINNNNNILNTNSYNYNNTNNHTPEISESNNKQINNNNNNNIKSLICSKESTYPNSNITHINSKNTDSIKKDLMKSTKSSRNVNFQLDLESNKTFIKDYKALTVTNQSMESILYITNAKINLDKSKESMNSYNTNNKYINNCTTIKENMLCNKVPTNNQIASKNNNKTTNKHINKSKILSKIPNGNINSVPFMIKKTAIKGLISSTTSSASNQNKKLVKYKADCNVNNLSNNQIINSKSNYTMMLPNSVINLSELENSKIKNNVNTMLLDNKVKISQSNNNMGTLNNINNIYSSLNNSNSISFGINKVASIVSSYSNQSNSLSSGQMNKNKCNMFSLNAAHNNNNILSCSNSEVGSSIFNNKLVNLNLSKKLCDININPKTLNKSETVSSYVNNSNFIFDNNIKTKKKLNIANSNTYIVKRNTFNLLGNNSHLSNCPLNINNSKLDKKIKDNINNSLINNKANNICINTCHNKKIINTNSLGNIINPTTRLETNNNTEFNYNKTIKTKKYSPIFNYINSKAEGIVNVYSSFIKNDKINLNCSKLRNSLNNKDIKHSSGKNLVSSIASNYRKMTCSVQSNNEKSYSKIINNLIDTDIILKYSDNNKNVDYQIDSNKITKRSSGKLFDIKVVNSINMDNNNNNCDNNSISKFCNNINSNNIDKNTNNNNNNNSSNNINIKQQPIRAIIDLNNNKTNNKINQDSNNLLTSVNTENCNQNINDINQYKSKLTNNISKYNKSVNKTINQLNNKYTENNNNNISVNNKTYSKVKTNISSKELNILSNILENTNINLNSCYENNIKNKQVNEPGNNYFLSSKPKYVSNSNSNTNSKHNLLASSNNNISISTNNNNKNKLLNNSINISLNNSSRPSSAAGNIIINNNLTLNKINNNMTNSNNNATNNINKNKTSNVSPKKFSTNLLKSVNNATNINSLNNNNSKNTKNNYSINVNKTNKNYNKSTTIGASSHPVLQYNKNKDDPSSSSKNNITSSQQSSQNISRVFSPTSPNSLLRKCNLITNNVNNSNYNKSNKAYQHNNSFYNNIKHNLPLNSIYNNNLIQNINNNILSKSINNKANCLSINNTYNHGKLNIKNTSNDNVTNNQKLNNNNNKILNTTDNNINININTNNYNCNYNQKSNIKNKILLNSVEISNGKINTISLANSCVSNLSSKGLNNKSKNDISIRSNNIKNFSVTNNNYNSDLLFNNSIKNNIKKNLLRKEYKNIPSPSPSDLNEFQENNNSKSVINELLNEEENKDTVNSIKDFNFNSSIKDVNTDKNNKYKLSTNNNNNNNNKIIINLENTEKPLNKNLELISNCNSNNYSIKQNKSISNKIFKSNKKKETNKVKSKLFNEENIKHKNKNKISDNFDNSINKSFNNAKNVDITNTTYSINLINRFINKINNNINKKSKKTNANSNNIINNNKNSKVQNYLNTNLELSINSKLSKTTTTNNNNNNNTNKVTQNLNNKSNNIKQNDKDKNIINNNCTVDINKKNQKITDFDLNLNSVLNKPNIIMNEFVNLNNIIDLTKDEPNNILLKNKQNLKHNTKQEIENKINCKLDPVVGDISINYKTNLTLDNETIDENLKEKSTDKNKNIYNNMYIKDSENIIRQNDLIDDVMDSTVKVYGFNLSNINNNNKNESNNKKYNFNVLDDKNNKMSMPINLNTPIYNNCNFNNFNDSKILKDKVLNSNIRIDNKAFVMANNNAETNDDDFFTNIDEGDINVNSKNNLSPQRHFSLVPLMNSKNNDKFNKLYKNFDKINVNKINVQYLSDDSNNEINYNFTSNSMLNNSNNKIHNKKNINNIKKVKVTNPNHIRLKSNNQKNSLNKFDKFSTFITDKNYNNNISEETLSHQFSKNNYSNTTNKDCYIRLNKSPIYINKLFNNIVDYLAYISEIEYNCKLENNKQKFLDLNLYKPRNIYNTTKEYVNVYIIKKAESFNYDNNEINKIKSMLKAKNSIIFNLIKYIDDSSFINLCCSSKKIYEKYSYYIKLYKLCLLKKCISNYSYSKSNDSLNDIIPIYLKYRCSLWKSIFVKSIYNKQNTNLKLNKQTLNNYINSCPDNYKIDIHKDLLRTINDDETFLKGNSNYKKLDNILKAYAYFNKEIGYVQGINFIVAYILYVFKEEEVSTNTNFIY